MVKKVIETEIPQCQAWLLKSRIGFIITLKNVDRLQWDIYCIHNSRDESAH
jgi:hypothetical protein